MGILLVEKKNSFHVPLVVNEQEKSDARKGRVETERKVMPGEGAPDCSTSRRSPFRICHSWLFGTVLELLARPKELPCSALSHANAGAIKAKAICMTTLFV